ncbi:MAG: bifunctional folylpolyglutamate synthase/dihydrofolate synthase [Alicyclobacillus herbarius]|uniref:bifunctional folylpolyglutamate synthase/dihydrofolate synthase n=1 Tax=Alicyclobacillus herbarius TaxID=122960 RepID=UPI00235795EF|nr:folylpolyglutamate synthase/dihydrofolate synthase family protein [Alicyclobacillus herbarius]MCL6631607.1 bifunctional folylpolyglutamate synthase/dihydrofolate synthase [Alicyclobacillus herbarius]
MAETITDALAWLKSRARFGVRPGLERMQKALAALEHPEQTLNFIHVAGTNGKGSVCAMISSILAQRLRVGTFTSPAFDGFRGRFMVNGTPIDPVDFSRLAEEVRKVSETALSDDPLTEFEALTLMALLYFQEQRVEAVVWETGLGGRLDSTNVVQPRVTVITNVGYDHQDVLGPTLRDIAFEKAGIIKSGGVPVVTGVRDEAWPPVRQAALRLGAPYFRHGIHFQAVCEQVTARSQRIYYRGLGRDVYGLHLPLFGRHQVDNVSLALAAVELCEIGAVSPRLSDEQWRQGLAETSWPGRFEVHWHGGAPIVLDGAHNPEAAAALARALAEFGTLTGVGPGEWVMVIGILRDKDAVMMLKTLLPYARAVMVSRPETARAIDPEQLASEIRACRPDLEVAVENSVASVMEKACQTGQPVCVWGSLYTVDEARKTIQEVLD